MSEDADPRISLGAELSYSVLAEHAEDGALVIDEVHLHSVSLTAPDGGIEHGMELRIVETGALPQAGETAIDVTVSRETRLQPHACI